MAQAVAEKTRVPHLFAPRDYQVNLMGFLGCGYKRYSGVWHRRAGKDKTAINLTISEMVKHIGAYYYFFPTYKQAKKVIWDGIDPRTGIKYLDHFPKSLMAKEPNNTEMKITFTNGSLFQLVGTDDFDAIMGTNPRGCVFSEYSLQDPRAWDYIRPILRENGGWAVFIFTFRGRNHGYALHEMAKGQPDWYTETLTVNDTKRSDGTPVITEPDIHKDRAEGMDEALVQQEYYCSPDGYIQGAYFSKQMQEARKEKRIGFVPHQAGQEVYTAWDLGIDDSMTIWFFQPIGKGFHFIDYYENSGYGLEHYAKIVKEKPYVYGGHLMPHDAEQREMTNGEIAKSRKEVAESLGLKPIDVVSRVKNIDTVIQVHIPAIRNVLASCWFDEKKCARGISALEGYHSEYDEERKILSNRPYHDWTSHGADGFRTFAVGYKEKVASSSIKLPPLPAGRPGVFAR